MSLPSVVKGKTSNKVSLVSKPNVTLVQPVQVIGSSASQPTFIYVQSIQPTSSQQAYITTKVNKPKILSQPVTIATSKPNTRPPAIPSTSTDANRVHTFQLKSQNIVPVINTHKPIIVGQTVVTPHIPSNEKQATVKITKISRPSPFHLSTNKFDRLTISTTSNSKTSAPNVTKLDPVKYRYRTILENLLQLKNNFVRRTITQAIQQKLCNQSNEDLLNVIFKSFELTLLSVNVEQIYLNETYLNATLAFLAKVIETGRFMELIENRKETKDITKFVTSEMSTILNKVSLESVYKNAREIFEQKQRGSYAQILELLIKAIGCVEASPGAKMSSSEIEFWLKEVLPLIFDGDDDIQTNAIEAVNKAIPFLLISRHQSNSHWQQVRSDILTEYTKKINNCFRQGSPKWYMIWCLCVQLLDIDIPRSASTLNAFLSIVEPALRSNVPIRRAEGYLCWKVLLKVLVRHNRLNSEKRLKLMCTPLKSLQAKTVEIAINKFQAWWYVISNIQENVDNYISMVFEPFLQFSFGPVLPEPNLSFTIPDAATQVKSFPDVSLMAIATFLRILDDSDEQIDELFVKFSLDQPTFTILTETIFSIPSSELIVINACGEATLMLNRLRNDANNNIGCITLSVCLWTRLFKHVNKAKKVEHINLILDNVSQLLHINSLNQNETKMIPVVCSSILGHIDKSFIFEQSDDNILSNGFHSIVKLMNTMILLPSMQTQFCEPLTKLLNILKNTSNFDENFTHFLTEFYDQFYKIEDNIDNNSEKYSNKLVLSYEVVDCILQFIQSNAENIKQMQSKNMRIPQIFYKIMYWPLSLSLNRNEFDIFTKNLRKTIDLLLTVISQSEFCKDSAIVVKEIIENPKNCIYINDAIATLFEYMVYDFDDLKNAPLDMLNLCSIVILRKDIKVLFQNLNSITEALIKYRRSITQKQFEIIASKLQEVIRLMDSEKFSFRTKPELLDDLKELVGDGSKEEKLPSSSQPNKPLRSNKKNDKDEFVVVNKIWKLEPGKLTEHQKEKMKTRRCDIPALYNDLSQSQDSASIQPWAPKSLPSDDLKNENIDGKIPTNEIVAVTAGDSPASQSVKKNINTSPKRPSQSQSQNNSVDRKSDSDKDTPDEVQSKRRTILELKRIHIDAKIEEVPYNSLSESNRLTRSTIKKIEEQPEVAQKRKTRSDSVKTVDIKTPDTKEPKKKTTRFSLANSPMTAKSKVKANIKSVNATENEISNEATPKRRQTRQSKVDELETEEPVQKTESKKTEFVDTLELKVEKLPIDVPSKYGENSKVKCKPSEENEEAMDVIKEDAKDLDQPQNDEKNDCSAIEAIERIVTQINSNIVDNITETQEVQANDQIENKMETEDTEVEQNAQILIETLTVSNSDETEPIANDACSTTEEHDQDMENEPNISTRSYMSALVFDGLSPSKSFNDSTFVTSPEIDAPRSLEFLNDTLNISPIVSESETAKEENIANNQSKKKLEIPENVEKIDKLEEEKQDLNVKTDKPLINDDIATEKASRKDNEMKNDDKTTIQSTTPSMYESPVVSSSSKKAKTSIVMQSSTPIQSHHSPVSSKFKTQLMGRGAQLLKMINNKNQKPSSPTPTPMSLTENAIIGKTASPSINQLETAPMFENVVSTPEPKTSKDRQFDKYEQNENGNTSTLTGVLPSPLDSPGISILKRKCSNISLDDSMHSPAAKRKRVSFGFPLSQTKEYIIDEDFTPFYMLPSNDSPCRRTNRLKKLKLKRNKNQNDNVKISSNGNKTPQLNDSNAVQENSSHNKGEEVSVKHIQEYIGMEMESYRAEQEKEIGNKNALITPAEKSNTNDLNSDDSSTESNEDDPEIEAIRTVTAKTLNDYSDDDLFSHLLSKYSPNDMLKKFESIIDAKILTKRLSSIMSNDKQVETSVLEELAENHSEAFLEHAITENLCSVICDRLTVKSPNGITDYTTEKINNDEQFASDFLDRVSVSLLRQKLMDTVTTSKREQHILLDDFLASLKDYISSTHRVSPKMIDKTILPEHIHLWVAKLFDQFKLSPEQYLQLTSIYIQKNPPETMSLD